MQSFVSRQHLALLIPAIAVTIALTSPVVTFAQSDAVDTDGVGVARISLIQGTVAVQRGDSPDTLAAALNAPLLGGDYITTGDTSRTEIQFDGSSQLRLGSGAQLRFTRLDTGDRTVQLAQGTLELRLLGSVDGSSEIDTPSISVKPQMSGAYRVTVTPDGQTFVTVRSGRAEVDTPQGNQGLEPGATLIAQGAAGNPTLQNVAAVAPDDFDTFNADRDRLENRAVADSAFVDENIDGIADLDANGRWVTDGSYGHVWIPAAVGTDWAPYRDGSWVWEDGYGWTWVATEPWGWAPYHYGSWYHSPDYGWAWYPPQPRVYTPWRPALVAFIGFGGGGGFSLGFGGGAAFGNIGWVPLAPFEPYHPWWGNRYGYGGGNTTVVNTVTNITNVTNVTNVNVYRNVQYNGVSSVTSQRFLQGNFTHNAPVAATELRQAQVFRSALPIVPTASNLRFTSAAAAPIVARPAFAGRSFAGNANVVARTSFASQRVALANVTHAPITPLHFRDAETTPLVPARSATTVRTGLPAPENTRIEPAVKPADATAVKGTAAGDPWTRFNQSRAVTTERQPAVSPPAVSAPVERRTYHAPNVERAPNTYHEPVAPAYSESTATKPHAVHDRSYSPASTTESSASQTTHAPAYHAHAKAPRATGEHVKNEATHTTESKPEHPPRERR